MDYRNYVIEVLDKEHGQKVKQHFIDLGFGKEISDYIFYLNRKDKDTARFYGFINGDFRNYGGDEIGNKGNIVHTLPEEKQYPRVMLVSNNEIGWAKRVVLMVKNGCYIAWSEGETLEEANQSYTVNNWIYAKDLPTPTKVTRTDIAKALGVDEFEIID
jgi:hypothetical protein